MRMSHIGICVSDWKRSLRFYHDVLGFRYVHELEVKGIADGDVAQGIKGMDPITTGQMSREEIKRGRLAGVSKQEMIDTLNDFLLSLQPMNQLGLTHLSLRVDDLDAQLAELTAAGVRVLEGTRIEIPRARSQAVFITDPDGTLIELVQQPGA